MMLSELGAEVIKVEQKGLGDETRHWGPPFVNLEQGQYMSSYFMSINKNKKSLALDLKNEESQKIMHDLVKKSDIVIENLLEKSKKFKIDYDSLKKIKSDLIQCSISGYGDPYKDRSGFDLTIQAQSGLMSITGEEDGSPMKVGYAICDVLCGQQVVQGVLAAILHKERTGEGQHIHTNLLQSTLYNMTYSSHQYLNTQHSYTRKGNQHQVIVPYTIFQLKDNHWIVLGVATDLQFHKLATALNIPIDHTNSTNLQRVQNRNYVNESIQQALQNFSLNQFQIICTQHSLPYSLINDDKSLSQSQLAQQIDMFQYIDHIKYYKYPLQFSSIQKIPDEFSSNAPQLGQHNQYILQNILQYDDSKIMALKQQGII